MSRLAALAAVLTLGSSCAYDPLGISRVDAGPETDAGSPDAGGPDAGSPDAGTCDCTAERPSECSGNGTLVLSFVASGICREGACAYAEVETTCPNGCAGGRCIGCAPSCTDRTCGSDGCGGSCGACTAIPTARCLDATFLRTFTSGGTCTDGACVYAPTDTDCPNGCHDGACLDCVPSCTGRECGSDGCGGTCGSCRTPPGPQCLDDQRLATWEANGACEAGACSYAQAETTCAHGCTNDVCCVPSCTDRECGSDGCGGVCGTGVCTTPPAPRCKDPTTLVRSAQTGSCPAGRCQYEETETPCPWGCADGACLPCVPNCTGKECGSDGCSGDCGTCPAPPRPSCVSPRVFVTYAGGQCTPESVCDYDTTESNCLESPNAVATCDPTLGCVDDCAPGYTLEETRCIADATLGLQPASPWPMEGGGPRHQRRSPFKGPQTNARRWAFASSQFGASDPVVGADGTIYFGAGPNAYAVTSAGAQAWTYPAGGTGNVRAAPAIAQDGTIYFGTEGNGLVALRPANGTLRWRYVTGGVVESPVVGPNGTIYIAVATGLVHAVKPDGTRDWTYATGGLNGSSPALGPDGTIYVVGAKSATPGKSVLTALTPGGAFKWEFAFDSAATSRGTPLVASDGTVYVGALDETTAKKLYAVDAEGVKKWEFSPAGWVATAPALGADGTLYFGCSDKKLYAVRSNGTLRWTVDLGAFVGVDPVVASDGTIYVGTWDRKLEAVRPNGTTWWDYSASDLIVGAPALGANGTAYITSSEGKLHAVGP